MPKKLGLSLSFCIRDIAEGRVDINDVHHIVTGCSQEHEQHVNGIIADYVRSYWRKCAVKAVEVFDELRRTNRIMWCSSFEKRPVCGLGRTVWLDWPD